MGVYEKIRFLAGPESRVLLFQMLDSGPTTQSEFTDQLSISADTVDRYLTDFAGFGWSKETQEGHIITSAGRVVLREYKKLLETIDRNDFEFLGGSKEATRPLLLRALSDPATRPELVKQCQVSDPTVYRAVTKEDGFEDRGWVLKRSDSQYIITRSGEDVLDAYDEFFYALKITEEKATVLKYWWCGVRRCSGSCSVSFPQSRVTPPAAT